MRSLGLLVAVTLWTSTALFAQHTPTTPPPPVVSPAASAPHNTAPTPTATHLGESGPHTNPSTAHLGTQTPAAKTGAARTSAATPNPEKHGLFSWLRKRDPVRSDSQDRRQEPRDSAANALARQIPPFSPLESHRCLIVPVSNLGIPCNPFAPCCD